MAVLAFVHILFLARVKEEASNVTRDSFKKVLNPNGTVKYMIYVPQGTTKCDQGNISAREAAKFKKHPIALPCSVKKLDFSVVWTSWISYLTSLTGGHRKCSSK